MCLNHYQLSEVPASRSGASPSHAIFWLLKGDGISRWGRNSGIVAALCYLLQLVLPFVALMFGTPFRILEKTHAPKSIGPVLWFMVPKETVAC
jgi:hypothetical protein